MGIFGFLIASMPSQFISDPNVRQVNYPDTWDSSSMLYIAQSYNYTTLGNSTDLDFDLGGRTQNLLGSYSEALEVNTTYLYHVTYSWIFFRQLEPCEWYTQEGLLINASHPNVIFWQEIDAMYNQSDSPMFKAIFTDYSMYVIFEYNTTAYTTYEEAFHAGELSFWCGLQFDQTNTSYNAWDIIALLLFFSMPDIHPAINALIAIPLWIVIVYVSFIIILRVVGAIFGGGGA